MFTNDISFIFVGMLRVLESSIRFLGSVVGVTSDREACKELSKVLISSEKKWYVQKNKIDLIFIYILIYEYSAILMSQKRG